MNESENERKKNWKERSFKVGKRQKKRGNIIKEGDQKRKKKKKKVKIEKEKLKNESE